MPEQVRLDDQFRDATGQPIVAQSKDDVLPLAADEVPLTDPSTQTKIKTFTVATAIATADVAATPAISIDEDVGTITSVTYTPTSTQAAPSSGNSRTWTLAGTEGTIATFLLDNSKSFTAATPVTFTVSHATVSEETLTLASAHGGASGAADPGGVLKVTYTF